MNREQRRNFKKQLNKTNLTQIQKDDIMYRQKIRDETPVLNLYEGDLVKLNYDRISSYPDYKRLRPEYIEFVEVNKDVVFTVEYDFYKNKNKDKTVNIMVQLKEDTTNPKFLFWSGDLILVKRAERKNELEEYMKGIEEKIKLLKGE